MTANLLRSLSFCARRLRFSPFNPTTSLSSLSVSRRFFSSTNIPPNQPHFSHSQKKNGSIDDVEDISNEEVKRRVAKLQEGDPEAIPSVFEAILQRYLTGKPIEDDQELMREILGKGTGSKEEEDDGEDDELDSDLEGMGDIDDDDEDVDPDFDFKRKNGDKQTKR